MGEMPEADETVTPVAMVVGQADWIQRGARHQRARCSGWRRPESAMLVSTAWSTGLGPGDTRPRRLLRSERAAAYVSKQLLGESPTEWLRGH